MIARLLVFVGALAVLGYAAGLVLAGDRFPAPGQAAGHHEVALLVVATLAAALFYVGACVVSHRSPPRLRWVLLVAAAARLLLLFGSPPPLPEGDHARLRFDGRLINRGVQPYEFTPDQLDDDATDEATLTGPALVRLTRARAAMSSSADAPRPAELRRPDLRPDSTPLALWVAALADRFKPQSTRGYAFLVLCADALAIFFLLLALRAMNLPASWVMVYAWCPVLLKEFYCTLSVDAFVVAGVAGLVWCIAAGRRALAAVPLALAAGMRLPLLLLGPVLGRRLGVAGLLLVVALTAAPFVPLHDAQVPVQRTFEGQLYVWRHYEYNSVLENPLRGLLRYLPQRAENTLTVAGVDFLRPGDRLHELLAKVFGLVVLLGVTVFLVIRVGPPSLFEEDERTSSLQNLFVLLVMLMVVSPVLTPAMALWLLPLLVLRPRGLSWLLLPGLLCLSHLTHLVGPFAADLTLAGGRVSFRVFEFGIFLALFALDMLWAGALFPPREPQEALPASAAVLDDELDALDEFETGVPVGAGYE